MKPIQQISLRDLSKRSCNSQQHVKTGKNPILSAQNLYILELDVRFDVNIFVKVFQSNPTNAKKSLPSYTVLLQYDILDCQGQTYMNKKAPFAKDQRIFWRVERRNDNFAYCYFYHPFQFGWGTCYFTGLIQIRHSFGLLVVQKDDNPLVIAQTP